MLINYTIKGYKSIEEAVKVDLDSTNYKILSKTNVNHRGILKGACFIGGNGVGKSNLVSPIRLLMDIMFSKNKIDLLSYFCLFSSDKIIDIEYNFDIKHSKVTYHVIIEYNQPMKIQEKLLLNNEIIMERNNRSAHFIISENNTVKSNQVGDYEFFLHDVAKASLLNTNKVLKEWYNFVINSIYFNCTEQKSFTYYTKEYGNENIELQIQKINDFFTKHQINYAIKLKEDNGKQSLRVLNTLSNISLPIQYEANGIKCLVNLIPCMYHIIKKGGVLVLDEFNIFHPAFTKAIIEEFNQNSENGQILIATNDTNILGADILRADQLYAVDFDNSTKITRFSIMQPRALQNMEKMYLDNKFGGLPKII